MNQHRFIPEAIDHADSIGAQPEYSARADALWKLGPGEGKRRPPLASEGRISAYLQRYPRCRAERVRRRLQAWSRVAPPRRVESAWVKAGGWSVVGGTDVADQYEKSQTPAAAPLPINFAVNTAMAYGDLLVTGSRPVRFHRASRWRVYAQFWQHVERE